MHVDLTNARAFLDPRDDVIRLTVSDPRLSSGVNVAVRRDSQTDRALRALFAAPETPQPDVEDPTYTPTYRFRRDGHVVGNLHYTLGPSRRSAVKSVVGDYFGDRIPHLVISGDAKTGKSSLLAHIALSLAMSNGPEDLRIRLLDPVGGPHLHPLIALDTVDTYVGPRDDVIGALEAELVKIHQREDLFRDARKSVGPLMTIQSARRRGLGHEDEEAAEPELFLPYVLIVLDDASYLDQNPRYLDLIGHIRDLGPRVGVYFAAASDRKLPVHFGTGTIVNTTREIRLRDRNHPNTIDGVGSLISNPREPDPATFALPHFSRGMDEVVADLLPSLAVLTAPLLPRPKRDGLLSVDHGHVLSGPGTGQVLTTSFTPETPHLLIGGGPGTGKTVLFRNALLTLAARNKESDLRIRLIDPRYEHVDLRYLPHIDDYVWNPDGPQERVFTDLTYGVLKRTVAEINRRKSALEGFRQRAFGAPRDRTATPPHFPFVILALADTRFLSPLHKSATFELRHEMYAALREIAREGGDYGVAVVIDAHSGSLPVLADFTDRCAEIRFRRPGVTKDELPKRHAVLVTDTSISPATVFMPFTGPVESDEIGRYIAETTGSAPE